MRSREAFPDIAIEHAGGFVDDSVNQRSMHRAIEDDGVKIEQRRGRCDR